MKSFLLATVVLALAVQTVYGLSCYTCMHLGLENVVQGANETELYNSCKWGENHNSTNVQECTNEHQVCGKLYFHAEAYSPALQIAWRGCIDSRPPLGTPEPNSCQDWRMNLFPYAIDIQYRYCNCDTEKCNGE